MRQRQPTKIFNNREERNVDDKIKITEEKDLNKEALDELSNGKGDDENE